MLFKLGMATSHDLKCIDMQPSRPNNARICLKAFISGSNREPHNSLFLKLRVAFYSKRGHSIPKNCLKHVYNCIDAQSLEIK